MRSLRRPLPALAVTVTTGAALALAGCHDGAATTTTTSSTTASAASSSSAATSSSGSASSEASQEAQTAKELAPFYAQHIDWRSCGDLQCGTLTVPVDYAKPQGGSIRLALKRQRSTSGSRAGSLVINPGGPGASGVDMVTWFPQQLAGRVTRHYDIVGFDPRGVAGSSPIQCLDAKQMDDYLGADPTPDDAQERAKAMAANKAFADSCLKRSGTLLPHVSTVEAAKDMDILRAALGDKKLNYYGASYGTFLGATYADLFAKNVGQMVLDGVIDPAQNGEQSALGQAKGFELATRSWAQHCVDTGDCPMGDSVDDVMKGLGDLLAQTDKSPLPAAGVGPGTLTEGWASMGLADAMYSSELWPTLDDALRQAKRGDGSGLMRMAMEYADRKDDGSYEGNMLQAEDAVNCLDRPVAGDADTYLHQEGEFTKVAPLWGRFMDWGDAVCGVWPVKPTGVVKPIKAAGSGPILVLGTTRDPATPYENSVALAKELEHGVLLTRDGDGHTGYTQGNSCVDHTVDDYLVDSQVPENGKKC